MLHDTYYRFIWCFSLPICKNKAKNRNKSHYTIDGIKKVHFCVKKVVNVCFMSAFFFKADASMYCYFNSNTSNIIQITEFSVSRF